MLKLNVKHISQTERQGVLLQLETKLQLNKVGILILTLQIYVIHLCPIQATV